MDRRLAGLALIALLIEAWLLMSDFHIFWKPPRVPVGATRVAKVLSVSRQAKARSSLQLSWFDLSPGQDLYEGDEVATMDRSDTTLKFVDGQTVTLEPNSFLVLRSGGLTGAHAFQISLLRGGLQQEGGSESATTARRSRLEIEVGGRKIVSQGLASVKIERSAGGNPEIAVGGGDVSVTEIGSRGIEIARKAPVVPVPAVFEVKPPTLQLPSPNAVLVNPGSVQLKWIQNDAMAAPTLVEVSRDPDFRDVVWHAILSSESSANFQPERKGHYFWRATRLGEKQLQSVASSFEVRRELHAPTLVRPHIERGRMDRPNPVDAPTLGRPVIHYPKERWTRPLARPSRPSVALVRAAIRIVAWVDGWLAPEAAAEETAPAALPTPVSSPTPAAAPVPPLPAASDEARYVVDLEWGRVGEASAYVLQIAADEEFKHVIAEKVLTQNKFGWRTDTAGFYYWRVAGVDKDGDRGPFSEFNTFSIKAERNKLGDESSYETYLRFDEYSKFTQNFRFSYGPIFDRYYFSSNDIPSSVIYQSRSWLNGQLSYEYRLTSFYSLQASFREARSQIGASNYDSRPDQFTLNQYDTQFSIGIEKRIFYPRHYLVLQTGVRATFLDLPVDSGQGDNQLVYSNFGFIGFYGAIGIHRLLGEKFDGSLLLGGAYQNTGDSFRATQYASIEVRRQLAESIHVGLKLDEVLSAYRLSADLVLTGRAHMLTFRPALVVDWSL